MCAIEPPVTTSMASIGFQARSSALRREAPPQPLDVEARRRRAARAGSVRVQNSVARSETSSCTSSRLEAAADGGARVLEHELAQLAPDDALERRGRDLPVIGEDEDVVAVLGHGAHGAEDLGDGAVDALQVEERQLGVGPAAVRVLVVAEVVEEDARHPAQDVDASPPASRRRA